MNNNDLINADLSDGAAVEDAGNASTTATSVAAPAAVTVRRSSGRPVDVNGKTNLGKARLYYAANPTATVKELKAHFESELKVSKPVAQTYASLVRKSPTA